MHFIIPDFIVINRPNICIPVRTCVFGLANKASRAFVIFRRATLSLLVHHRRSTSSPHLYRSRIFICIDYFVVFEQKSLRDSASLLFLYSTKAISFTHQAEQHEISCHLVLSLRIVGKR